MNLDEVLDVTEPVEVTFKEQKLTVHVYTAGADRLTNEEIGLLQAPNTNGSGATENANVDYVRSCLPIIAKGVDLNGEPLTYKGVAFPDNVKLFPNALLGLIGNAALDKWNAANPTSGEESPDGEQPKAVPERSQTASATP